MDVVEAIPASWIVSTGHTRWELPGAVVDVPLSDGGGVAVGTIYDCFRDPPNDLG